MAVSLKLASDARSLAEVGPGCSSSAGCPTSLIPGESPDKGRWPPLPSDATLALAAIVTVLKRRTTRGSMVDGPPQPADDDNAKAQARRRLVRRLAVVGLVASACWCLAAGLRALDPGWLYPPLTETDLHGVSDAAKVQELKGARLKLQNDARTTLLQGLGALLVLTGAGIGASVTLGGVRATRGQIRETRHGQPQAAQAHRAGPGHRPLHQGRRAARPREGPGPARRPVLP